MAIKSVLKLCVNKTPFGKSGHIAMMTITLQEPSKHGHSVCHTTKYESDSNEGNNYSYSCNHAIVLKNCCYLLTEWLIDDYNIEHATWWMSGYTK